MCLLRLVSVRIYTDLQPLLYFTIQFQHNLPSATIRWKGGFNWLDFFTLVELSIIQVDKLCIFSTLAQSREEYPQQCCGSFLVNPRSRLNSNGFNGIVRMCSHSSSLCWQCEITDWDPSRCDSTIICQRTWEIYQSFILLYNYQLLDQTSGKRVLKRAHPVYPYPFTSFCATW